MTGHKREEDLVVNKFWVMQDAAQKWLVGVDTFNRIATQCIQCLKASSLEGWSIDLSRSEANELTHERIVVHAWLAALIESSINAHTLAFRLLVSCDLRPTTRSQRHASLDC